MSDDEGNMVAVWQFLYEKGLTTIPTLQINDKYL